MRIVLTVILAMNLCIVTPVEADDLSAPNENSNEVLIFISFSIPVNSLAGLVCASAKNSCAFSLIRGLVNDSFLDTQKAVKGMMEDQQGGVMIDPRLLSSIKSLKFLRWWCVIR